MTSHRDSRSIEFREGQGDADEVDGPGGQSLRLARRTVVLDQVSEFLRVEGKKCMVGPKYFSVTRDKGTVESQTVFWTEVPKANDPRTSSPEMKETMRSKIVGPVKRGLFVLFFLPNERR